MFKVYGERTRATLGALFRNIDRFSKILLVGRSASSGRVLRPEVLHSKKCDTIQIIFLNDDNMSQPTKIMSNYHLQICDEIIQLRIEYM